MSLDRSLKSKASLSRHRNVLSRAERLQCLTEEERWSESKSVFGLPKVAHRKSNVGKKIKEPKAGEEAAAAAAAPGAARAAATAAPADTGKAAGKAPAKGEKEKRK